MATQAVEEEEPCGAAVLAGQAERFPEAHMALGGQRVQLVPLAPLKPGRHWHWVRLADPGGLVELAGQVLVMLALPPWQ